MTFPAIPPDERLLPCPFCGSANIAKLKDASRPVALVSFQCEPCGVQTAWRQGLDYAIAAWNRRSRQPDREAETAWAECFDAQKSMISFLRETLEQIKRDNRHYNFGSKLVRIVDDALAKAPKASQPDREAVEAATTEDSNG